MKKANLHIMIERSLKKDAESMAESLEQTMSGYVRLAIKEKISRDKRKQRDH